jgi:hypothetical protein
MSTRFCSKNFSFQANLKQAVLLFSLFCICLGQLPATAQERGSFGLTSFTFANYLGTGFYTTSNGEVFVFQLPFDYTIREMTDEQPGWLLKLPVTFGVINFDNFDQENLPQLSDVTTLTFLPGIEYQYPVTKTWNINPFLDYGLARDFNYDTNIIMTGTGIKSYAHFNLETSQFILGNKLLYARERSNTTGNNNDYTLIETGLNYRMYSDHVWNERQLHFNVYYVYYYYPDDLVFFERTTTPIRVGHEYEFGFTISNLPDMLFMERPQIGLGIRRGSNVTAYRIVFGMPF